MSAHYLYRCYDVDGRLLYIGCTKDVERRLSLHRRDPRRNASRWLRVTAATHEVEGPYADRKTALAAEGAAIYAEQPLFNVQERGLPTGRVLSGVAEYLIDRGHLKLAAETACTCWQDTLAAGEFDEWCVAHRELVSQ